MLLDPVSFLQIDLPAILAALLATCACALLGNFLVLRRQSLMGDAITHAVLPGLVAGMLVTGDLSGWPMFAGALVAALLASALIELVRRLGRLESGAAMGVVFSIFFAAGVVMIEQVSAGSVHIDPDCVLYGQLEHILWLAPTGWASLLDPTVWRDLPGEVTTLAIVALLVLGAVLLFYKELKLASFDPGLASSLGFPAGVVGMGLMLLVGAVAVAAFAAVGSILVVAMFICPAAAARLLTRRLAAQLWLSQAFAALSAVGGYALAAFGPQLLGGEHSLAASGMIAVVAGLILAVAAVAASLRDRLDLSSPADGSPEPATAGLTSTPA
jgi:manganese/zinc/iron transport system permease protein